MICNFIVIKPSRSTGQICIMLHNLCLYQASINCISRVFFKASNKFIKNSLSKLNWFIIKTLVKFWYLFSFFRLMTDFRINIRYMIYRISILYIIYRSKMFQIRESGQLCQNQQWFSRSIEFNVQDKESLLMTNKFGRRLQTRHLQQALSPFIRSQTSLPRLRSLEFTI